MHICRQHTVRPEVQLYNPTGSYKLALTLCDECGSTAAQFRCRQCGALTMINLACPDCGNTNWESVV